MEKKERQREAMDEQRQERTDEYVKTLNSASVYATKINDALRVSYKYWFPGNVFFNTSTNRVEIGSPKVTKRYMSKKMQRKKRAMEEAYIILNNLRGKCLVTLRGRPIKARMYLTSMEDEIIHGYFLSAKEKHNEDGEREVEEENDFVAPDGDDPVTMIEFESGIPLTREGMMRVRAMFDSVIDLLGTPSEFRNNFLRKKRNPITPYPDNWDTMKKKAFERYEKIHSKVLGY